MKNKIKVPKSINQLVEEARLKVVPKKRGPGRPRKITTGNESYLNQIKEQEKEIKRLNKHVEHLANVYKVSVSERNELRQYTETNDYLKEIIKEKDLRIADLEEKLKQDDDIHDKFSDKCIELEATKGRLLIAEERLQSINSIGTSLKMIHDILYLMNKRNSETTQEDKRNWFKRIFNIK